MTDIFYIWAIDWEPGVSGRNFAFTERRLVLFSIERTWLHAKERPEVIKDKIMLRGKLIGTIKSFDIFDEVVPL